MAKKNIQCTVVVHNKEYHLEYKVFTAGPYCGERAILTVNTIPQHQIALLLLVDLNEALRSQLSKNP